jgi:hypothetical protein
VHTSWHGSCNLLSTRRLHGTDLATLLAHAILTRGVRNVVAGASAVDLKRRLAVGLNAVVESLRSLSSRSRVSVKRRKWLLFSEHNNSAIGGMLRKRRRRWKPKNPRPRSACLKLWKAIQSGARKRRLPGEHLLLTKATLTEGRERSPCPLRRLSMLRRRDNARSPLLIIRLSDIEFGLLELRARNLESAAVRTDDFDHLLGFINKMPARQSAAMRTQGFNRILLLVVHGHKRSKRRAAVGSPT